MIIDLRNVEPLNSEKFRMSNYIADWWYLLDIKLIDLNLLNLEHSIKDIIIGYCDANRLYFKPKEDHYAVMVEKIANNFGVIYLKKIVFYNYLHKN